MGDNEENICCVFDFLKLVYSSIICLDLGFLLLNVNDPYVSLENSIPSPDNKHTSHHRWIDRDIYLN